MVWDRELAELETAIRQLDSGYDVFLYGSGAKPPLEARRRVDSLVHKLNGLTPETAADGFRLSALQTRYNTLCERWDRLQSEKEAGRRPGIYGRITRSASDEVSPPHLNAAAPASVEPRGDASSARRETPTRGETERELFERYVGAKKNKGEDVRGYDFARFAETLEREREKLKQRLGAVDIEFDLTERDGRVKLVARRKGS
jgi:hypothetical protein